jgi:hypothetical protein
MESRLKICITGEHNAPLTQFKRLTIVLLLTTITFFVKAQQETSLTFNSTHSGRNIALTYSNTFLDKHEIGGGLRYNINLLAHTDDQNNVFLKRLYATKPIHYVGAELFYRYHFLSQLKCIKPFVFYDAQATYSTTRNRMLLPGKYDTDGKVIYKEYIENFGPFTWVEQCAGIGLKVEIAGAFFITEQAGVGVSFMLGRDPRLLATYNAFEWEFGLLFSAGIGYRFH